MIDDAWAATTRVGGGDSVGEAFGASKKVGRRAAPSVAEEKSKHLDCRNEFASDVVLGTVSRAVHVFRDMTGKGSLPSVMQCVT